MSVSYFDIENIIVIKHVVSMLSLTMFFYIVINSYHSLSYSMFFVELKGFLLLIT